MKILYIEGRRDGYAPEQCGKTMTVGALVKYLRQFNDDIPIYINNDNGYTYGSIDMDSFNLAICDETENVNKIEVRFLGGQSRYGADTCNYMQVKVDDEELYAEEILTGTKFDVPCEDGEEFDSSDFDDYSYPLLKAEIIRQAEEKGIDVNRLEFYWD